MMKISGDVKSGDGRFEFDVSGFEQNVGQFAFQRSFEWNTGELTVTGRAETEKGFLNDWGLSPMETDVKLDWDTDWGLPSGHVTMHFDGEKYQIVVDENRIEFDV